MLSDCNSLSRVARANVVMWNSMSEAGMITQEVNALYYLVDVYAHHALLMVMQNTAPHKGP